MTSFAHPLRRGAAVLALVLLVAACGGEDADPDRAAPGTSDAPSTDVPGADPIDDRPRSPFTGLPTDPDVLARPLLVVKIENSAPSRPQAGLDAADVVIEKQVEGGMTRFMALLHGELPDVAGPVRSARPVDVDLLSGLGASGLAYTGARAEVEGLLASTPSIRLDVSNPPGFRVEDRRAPHNLYIRPAEVLEVVERRGARPLVDIGWVFDDIAPEGALTCPTSAPDCPDPGASVVIAFSNSFRTGWTYDAAAGVYRREQNGRPFLADGPGEIGAANVVVLATRHYLGASGYPETDATTAGAPAIVLRDGRRYEARWEKPTAADLLRILTLDGEPFPLKPGSTWVHLPSADRMPEVG